MIEIMGKPNDKPEDVLEFIKDEEGNREKNNSWK